MFRTFVLRAPYHPTRLTSMSFFASVRALARFRQPKNPRLPSRGPHPAEEGILCHGCDGSDSEFRARVHLDNKTCKNRQVWRMRIVTAGFCCCRTRRGGHTRNSEHAEAPLKIVDTRVRERLHSAPKLLVDQRNTPAECNRLSPSNHAVTPRSSPNIYDLQELIVVHRATHALPRVHPPPLQTDRIQRGQGATW